MPPVRDDVLAMSVQFLKGAGPRKAELLGRLGIETVLDLIYHLPREHVDWTRATPVARARPGTECVLRGRVAGVRLQRLRRNLARLTAVLEDDTGTCEIVWWNQPYLRERLAPGAEILVSGKIRGRAGRPEIAPERGRFLILGKGEPAEEPQTPNSKLQTGKAEIRNRLSSESVLGIQPIYPETEGLSSRLIRPMVRSALDAAADAVPEPLPESVRRAQRLTPIAEALRQIHFPDSEAARAAAHRRLVFEELFILQVALAARRRSVVQERVAHRLRCDGALDLRIRRRFPFALTRAQERAVREIRADLLRPCPMNRLLHGDVGSGKTIVAAYALLAAIGNRRQAAIMAPTELLAEQHVRTMSRILANSKVRVGHLAGGLPDKERRDLLGRIAAGEVDLVIGTHALIQSDVAFRRLALVVVDEQHKFGVLQRAALRAKGLSPHVLVMTATPIPRTLALTVFGDLDVSVLDEMPPGRKPIRTLFRPPDRRDEAYEFIRGKLREGRQAYFVYPRIEGEEATGEVEGGLSDVGASSGSRPSGGRDPEVPLTPASGRGGPGAGLRSAKVMAKKLAEGPLAGFRVGLVHGAMDAGEKERAMERFRAGEIQALVSTLVIEVGIDVPNATIMAIDHAERFGLAQLHQLRGRVGRGGEESYCFLFGAPEGPEARRRLEVMTETQDGFRIAEEDLRLRGPGEFFGTAQSGLPPLRIADLFRDQRVLGEARRGAFALVERDPRLADRAHAGLRAALRARFKNRLRLAGIG